MSNGYHTLMKDSVSVLKQTAVCIKIEYTLLPPPLSPCNHRFSNMN